MITDALEALWPTACAGCSIRGQGRLCPKCQPLRLRRISLPFEGVSGGFAGASYDSGVGTALRYAKGAPDRALAVRLGQHLARCAERRAWPQGAVVVPAPSPWRRRVSRGFNPAALLAACIAPRLGLPVVDVLRMADGPRQALQTRRARARSLAGRLRCPIEVRRPILVVDDVVTTGATAQACAQELLGAGAPQVWVLALCVAPAPTSSVHTPGHKCPDTVTSSHESTRLSCRMI